MPATPAVDLPGDAAVAVGRGGRSRRAVRWAADNLAPHAARFVLVHVIPSVSSVPSPSGRRTPVAELEPEVVDLYVEDLKSRAAQRVISPLKALCRRKNVESLVLDAESAAAGLARFLAESGTANLVMGCSSFGWITRILNGPDVPTVVLNSAPDSCNIFVVSRHRLKLKFANQSVLDGTSNNMQIQKVRLRAFDQKGKNYLFNKRISSHSSTGDEMLELLAPSEADTSSQSGKGDKASILSGGNSEADFLFPRGSHCKDSNLGKIVLDFQTLKIHDQLDPYKDVIMNSEKKVEVSTEVVRLQQELQNTLAMYKSTCEGLVLARKKVAALSSECSLEAQKVKDALEREKVLKRIAEEEKGKCLEAIKQVEAAKRLLTKEALDRHKAEIVATTLSSEKFKVLDSFFSSGKHCRRYSKNEIETATDNFSEAKKIGEGAYGKVYKCILDHVPVAIKVLHQDAHDKKEEFLREVEILSQLRHPHMLMLLGGCPEIGCLVYEYMENGSLDDVLFCRGESTPLPWFVRFRIIFEVACGLAFLHGTKPEPIVHRDLKPGNILLDRNYVSKIGDVGLAKLISDVVPDSLTEYRETIISGTLLYMDPEYQRTGTIRPKSDLYALGIIALQLLTAKHPRGLVTNVENAIDIGTFPDLLDKSISDWPIVEAERLARLALKCSRLRCRERPDLDSEVLPELEELLEAANVCSKLRQCNVYAPSNYLCPILQEIMENPYIAADGYTYEHRAIKAWLVKHKISPVTKLRLPHTCIIPNRSLHSAIQEWKSSLAYAASAEK